MIASREVVNDTELSVGDELFGIGLFNQFYGNERIQPIVRFGRISLMPIEPIPLKLSFGSDVVSPVFAHLAELTAWGGQSGAPVFVYVSPYREPGSIRIGDTRLILVGLIYGHFETPQDVSFTGDFLGHGTVPMNVGMTAIIPAQDILDTLYLAESFQLADSPQP
jgi:hypothetical protein